MTTKTKSPHASDYSATARNIEAELEALTEAATNLGDCWDATRADVQAAQRILRTLKDAREAVDAAAMDLTANNPA